MESMVVVCWQVPVPAVAPWGGEPSHQTGAQDNDGGGQSDGQSGSCLPLPSPLSTFTCIGPIIITTTSLVPRINATAGGGGHLPEEAMDRPPPKSVLASHPVPGATEFLSRTRESRWEVWMDGLRRVGSMATRDRRPAARHSNWLLSHHPRRRRELGPDGDAVPGRVHHEVATDSGP
jgi:hypothetical protein